MESEKFEKKKFLTFLNLRKKSYLIWKCQIKDFVLPGHPTAGPILQDSLDQCTMPINADQNSGIDPYVDQFRSMPTNADQFRAIPLNADQCRSMQINARSSRIGIDWH